MDKMAVDMLRPKLATELPAHGLAILDKIDQQVRTKPSLTTELSNVASWHRARHQLSAQDKVCHDTALGFSFDCVHAEQVWVCFHKLGAMGYNCIVPHQENECVHCHLVRPWVFRSSIEVFEPLFGPVAAERDVSNQWNTRENVVENLISMTT